MASSSALEYVMRSVGIDLKELGVSCRNVWNFAQGLKFKADFHSKMGVCRHSTPNPPTILTLKWLDQSKGQQRPTSTSTAHDELMMNDDDGEEVCSITLAIDVGVRIAANINRYKLLHVGLHQSLVKHVMKMSKIVYKVFVILHSSVTKYFILFRYTHS